MNINIDPYFPLKTAIRDEQKNAIQFALHAFLIENKSFVIIEAGTGVGKSAIGITIARYLQSIIDGTQINNTTGCYILTTQKILQEQYMRDFGTSDTSPLPLPATSCDKNNNNNIGDIEDIEDIKLMKTILSAENFKCTSNTNVVCSSTQRLLKTMDKSSAVFKNCSHKCIYKQKKKEFMDHTEGVTNYSYFMAETSYSKQFVARNLLIMDEGHNIYKEVAGFIDVLVTSEITQLLNIEFPSTCDITELFMWVSTIYEPNLMLKKHNLSIIINNFDTTTATATNITKKDTQKKKDIQNKTNNNNYETIKLHETIDKLACKSRRFLKFFDPNNWVASYINNTNNTNNTSFVKNSKNKKNKELQIKPIDISCFVNDLLYNFGEKRLILSATIINKSHFCKLNGIPESLCSFISIPSPFPLLNRPIYYQPVGSMCKIKVDETLVRMVKKIDELLNKHNTVKGIIHCHTYKIGKFIYDNISILNKERLLTHTVENRQEIINNHCDALSPMVLLSPSMTEGVDLKDELSRFQIICKIPFPYLGDPIIRKKMEKWSWYYNYETIISFVQSLGRSIRNQSDFADSYILDSCWNSFKYNLINNNVRIVVTNN